MLVVAGLAAAVGLSLLRTTTPYPVPAAAAARATQPSPVVTAVAPIVTVAAPVVAAAPSAPSTDELAIEPLVLEAPDPLTVNVTVKSVPDGAIFFESGKRLGTGVVRVSVGRGAKLRLTALLDGYEPLNFKLDGSRDTLSVRLTPVHPALPVAPAVLAPGAAATPAADATVVPAAVPAAPAAPLE